MALVGFAMPETIVGPDRLQPLCTEAGRAAGRAMNQDEEMSIQSAKNADGEEPVRSRQSRTKCAWSA